MQLPAQGGVGQGFSQAHQAVDLGSIDFFGTPIVAPHSGTITFAGKAGTGINDAGKCVDIDGGRFKSRPCHMDTITVSVGQVVRQGQQVGTMGCTGYVKPAGKLGTHCHWVLWDDGVRVDGLKYISQGGTMDKIASFEWLQNASQFLLGRKTPVDRAWYNSNPAERSMTESQVYNIWTNSQEAKDFRFKGWDYDRLVKEGSGDATPLKPGKYLVK